MNLQGKSRERGFTLLEVLVASAILIASMGLLLQLFGSGLDRMHRVGEHAKLIMAEKEIYHRLSTLNPATATQGKGEVFGWPYNWTARQVEPYRIISEGLGEQTFPRYVALYALDVSLERPERPNLGLEYLRLGWRATP